MADETYLQQVTEESHPEEDAPRVRRTKSEVFFMFTPATRDWMAIRDVISLDGRAVADRPDIKDALERLPPREVSRKFKQCNSRYNIGRTYRNFNEPTFALLVLDEQHRSRFSFSR